MTVEQLEKKYDALQKEGNDIYAQMKPLFKRLKSLAKKSQKLGYKIDNDIKLYEKDVFGILVPKDWNDNIMFRLNDLDFVENAIDGIDNVLYNLNHTKFWKKGHQKMVKVRVSTGPNSSATIAVPEEVIKGLPPMDM